MGYTAHLFNSMSDMDDFVNEFMADDKPVVKEVKKEVVKNYPLTPVKTQVIELKPATEVEEPNNPKTFITKANSIGESKKKTYNVFEIDADGEAFGKIYVRKDIDISSMVIVLKQ